jgi:hypothetical protein
MHFFNLIAREYSYDFLFVCFSVSFIYLFIFILLNNFYSMITKLIPLVNKRIYGSLMVYHVFHFPVFFVFLLCFVFVTKVLHTLMCFT